jgi:hypothetical protein
VSLVTTTNIGDPLVDNWKDKTIILNDSWGPGAIDLLTPPLGGKAEITLRARYVRDSKGVRQFTQLQAECASGYIGDMWQGAVFTPLGTAPVAGITGLPPWDGSQATTKKYRDMIASAKLDSGTMRLETVLPFLGANGGVGYDTVRLFYASNAVQGADIPDLVIIKTATLVPIPGVVGVLQEGGGSGPPH